MGLTSNTPYEDEVDSFRTEAKFLTVDCDYHHLSRAGIPNHAALRLRVTPYIQKRRIFKQVGSISRKTTVNYFTKLYWYESAQQV